MKTNQLTTKEMAIIGALAAVICVLGPLTLQVGPIPFSLAPIGVMLAPTVLKGFKGLISILIYLLIGLIGLPVFSGFSGGFAKFASPTGGYLLGYLLAGLIICIAKPLVKNLATEYLVLVIALIGLYLLGVSWLAVSTGMGYAKALSVGAYPFIIPDLIKAAIALFLGNVIRKRLDLALA